MANRDPVVFLRKNTRKRKDTDPDYTGTWRHPGENDCWANAWLNQDGDGETYLRITKGREKEPREGRRRPRGNEYEARQRNQERRAALRTLEECRARASECLGDLSRDALHAAVARLREQLGDVSADAPADLDGAKTALTAAERARERTEAALTAAKNAVEETRRRLSAIEERERGAKLRLEHADGVRRSLAERLAAERDRVADAELSQRLAAAEGAATALERDFARDAERVASTNPELVESLLRDAQEGLEAASAERRAAEDERLRVEERVAFGGGQGLHERCGEAEAALLRATREAEAQRRRAAAARLLFETLRDARDATRRAHQTPLRSEIEALGRQVFGPSFGVELDDQLRVARRTLDGVTLDFEQLSGGAREQVALLARLACARLVADEGGVPAILDDALGYSDPERLEALGRALAAAGRTGQVIVLTCVGDRYRRVPGARLVRIA